MNLFELLDLFSAEPINIVRISGAIRELPKDEWEKRLWIAPWNGMVFLHALMLNVVNLSDKAAQRILLFDIIENAPGNVWDLPSTVKSNMPLLTARSCLSFLLNTENDPALLPLLIKVLERIPAENWRSEIEQYIKATTELLLNKPDNLANVQFFKFLAFSDNAEPDFWVRPTLVRANEKEISIAPLSALINTLRITLEYSSNENNALMICKELIRALSKISEKSRDTDWEPLLIEDSSDSVLNELMDLIIDHPKNVVLNFIAKQVLEKASQDAIDVISADRRKKLVDNAPLSDISNIIKKRTPIIKKPKQEVRLINSKFSLFPESAAASEFSAPVSSRSSGQGSAVAAMSLPCSEQASLFAESAAASELSAPVSSRSSSQNSEVAAVLPREKVALRSKPRYTHNPYSLFQSTIFSRTLYKRSALAIAFDPTRRYS